MHDYKTLAGYRAQRKTQYSDQPVVVYDAIAQGLADDDYRWAIVCEGHGQLLTAETLRLAISAAREPEEWCDCCRDKAASLAAYDEAHALCDDETHPDHNES